MLLRSGRFMDGDKRQKKQVSLKLMASLAPTQAKVGAGVLAKADQLVAYISLSQTR
jgi:hypothetical protein